MRRLSAIIGLSLVAGMGMALADAENGVTRLLPFNRLRKGIGVSAEGNRVVVDIHVVLEHGVNMASVSSNLTSSVKFILKQIAELDDVEVRVHVEGVRTR